jgi:hypothetical protein
MRTQKIAYGLALGSLLSLGAWACDDDETTSGTTGTTPFPNIPADCTTDTDTGTARFVLTHLGLPNSAGFDIDHIDNSPAPQGMGATVAGCGKPDLAGGADNALATIAASLTSLIDLDGALQDTLARPAADGGTEGSLTLTIALSRIGAGTPENDASICATMTVVATDETGSSMDVVEGRGAIVNDNAFLVFADPILFDIALPVPSATCNGGSCNPGDVQIVLRDARARLALNGAHTAIGAGSLLGGFMFFADPGPAYASANSTGFAAALQEFAAEVNLTPAAAMMSGQAFAAARDLHMDPSGAISPCTGANTSSTNSNAISVGLAIDSLGGASL